MTIKELMDKTNARISALERKQQEKPKPLRQKEIDVLSNVLKDLMTIYQEQDLSFYEEMDSRPEYLSHGRLVFD